MDSEPNEDFLPYIARIVTSFGKYYNGFESHGTHHIPKKGPALIVFYHALNPLDAWYFGLNYYLENKRLIRGLGDRWLFKTPGLSWLVRAVGAIPGSPEGAIKLLKHGHLVGVSPGGVREAISGTSKNYKLVWNNRMGFARVALQAGVDILPGFTENVDEMYRAPFADTQVIQKLYERTRLPLVPIVGLGLLPFPVKLRTWIGEPIKITPGDTPEKLALRTKHALEELIKKHQTPNQTITNALFARFLSRRRS